MNGIILVDKPSGMTSFSVDSKVRRLSGTKKTGHSGTLDPFATGLLPVYVGDALKVMRYTDNYDKAYRCRMFLGKTTDTLDTEGEVTSTKEWTAGEIEAIVNDDYKVIRDAFSDISRTTSQKPPMYSAKKINGKKAYELAREGKEVDLPPHPIKIMKMEIEEILPKEDGIEVLFYVECSKGTYIRTICDDIGKLTGFGAYALELRRTKAGPFDVDQAYTLETIEKMIEQGDESFLTDATKTVSYMKEIPVDDVTAARIKQGKKILAKPFKKYLTEEMGTLYRVTNNDKLIAVMYVANEDGNDILRIDRMLANGNL